MNTMKTMQKGFTLRYSNVWKLISDSLISISGTITGFAIYEKIDWLGYAALLTMMLGKVTLNIAEYFSNEK